jgi:hypothetical protein
VKPVDISREKRVNISKATVINLKPTVSARISKTCIEEKMNLRGSSNPELTT